MEGNGVAERNPDELNDIDGIELSIYDRIFQAMPGLGFEGEEFAMAFMRERPHERIALIKQINSVLSLMKDFVDSEVAALNELHSEIK